MRPALRSQTRYKKTGTVHTQKYSGGGGGHPWEGGARRGKSRARGEKGALGAPSSASRVRSSSRPDHCHNRPNGKKVSKLIKFGLYGY
eukprot:scaffold20262_cov115-Isochrysis_galbana.AAC.4